MSELLKCNLCDYQAKQLFQHIKSVHKISVSEYRGIFGNDVKMQFNFNAPINSVNPHNSSYVKKGYVRLFDELERIADVYSFTETISLLKREYFYKDYMGKSKNRTMLRLNPVLYKSIYLYSKPIEDAFKSCGKDKGNYNFAKRIVFLVEYNGDVSKLRCECGSDYTWNSYCRYCPTNPNRTSFLGKKMTETHKSKIRKATISYLESVSGQLVPRYNSNSIPIIEQKARELGITDLQHAENGGEYCVRELGYWVDGYSKEQNVVIEYDERHHFDENGNLRERDVIRQNEIQQLLGCEFIRIKEGSYVY